MKRVLFFLLLALGAASEPKPGQIYRSVKADLNGDGKPDKIGLVAYGHSPGGYYGRLKVWDSSGKLLWQGPAVKSSSEPFAFGSWEYGSSDIEWFNADQLISALPQSDVRPTTYKRFRWTGSSYEFLGNSFLLGSGDDFVWSKPFEWDGVKPLTWVTTLVDGHVTSVHGGDQYMDGTARLEPTANGFRVVRWLKKLSSS